MIARMIKEKINHENDDDDDAGDDILHPAHDRHLRDLWELAAALRLRLMMIRRRIMLVIIVQMIVIMVMILINDHGDHGLLNKQNWNPFFSVFFCLLYWCIDIQSLKFGKFPRCF